MPRIIAIDYGLKRVGIAATDELQIVANPLDTIPNNKIWEFLKKYLSEENVECIVIGLPKRLNNEATHITEDVHHFKNKVTQLYPEMKIELHDERFTSKMAMAAMVAGGMKKKDRAKKENLDKISASIILQSYLESKSFL